MSTWYAPAIGATVALGALAPVLPGRYASSATRFVLVYILLLMLAFGVAALVLYLGGQDSKPAQTADIQHHAGYTSIPLGSISALVLGLYAASRHYETIGSVVFALLHSLFTALLAGLFVYWPQ